MFKTNRFIDPEIISNLPQQLLNTIRTYTVKGLQEQDLRLYQRKNLDFRSIIDNVLPSMLIIDFNNIKRELEIYNDLIPNLQQLLGTEYKPLETDFKVAKLSVKEIELILTAIKNGIENLIAKPITSIELQRKLQVIVAKQDTNIVKEAQVLFQPIYRLVDIKDKIVFVFPSFDSLRDRLKRALDIGLSTALGLEENVKIENISQYLDYGHTAVLSDNVLQFNSPKLLAIMFDVLNSNTDKESAIKQAYQASVKFLDTTKQIEETLEISKEFGDGFVKLFISIGGNVIRFENSIINQRRGSILEKKEKRGINRLVLAQLAKELSTSNSRLGKQISKLLLFGRSSPSLLEHLTDNIVNNISGNPTKKSSNKSKTTKKTTVKDKQPLLSGFVNNTNQKLPKLTKPTLKYKPIPSEVNLNSLLLYINSNLQNIISANMGDGTRRDILNYRTGRFAESVQVESLSQSRQGMITAFYSYMKNPYATFSQGGRQQYPRTRDPKLLISTSIRDLAQQKVTARLRAVVV